MKQIKAQDLVGKTPEEIGDLLSGGIKIVEIATPLLKELFDKFTDFVSSLGKNNPNSPRNVRLRLAALEQKDVLQKELNKVTNAQLAEQAELLASLKERLDAIAPVEQ